MSSLGLKRWCRGKECSLLLRRPNLDSVLSTYLRWLTTTCESYSNGSDAPFWPQWALQVHGTQISRQMHKYVNKNIEKCELFKITTCLSSGVFTGCGTCGSSHRFQGTTGWEPIILTKQVQKLASLVSWERWSHNRGATARTFAFCWD